MGVAPLEKRSEVGLRHGDPSLAALGKGEPEGAARLADPTRPEKRRPLGQRASNARLGMAIFLGSEVMLFAGLISAFLVLRAGSQAWPPPAQPRLPAGVTALDTLALLVSGFTVTRARRARERTAAFGWLVATAWFGTLFLTVQGSEWLRLLAHGLRASESLYAATFYTLIGAHGLHVLGALGALLWLIARMYRRPAGFGAALDAVQLYWLFVVAVWPLLYAFVYLS